MTFTSPSLVNSSEAEKIPHNPLFLRELFFKNGFARHAICPYSPHCEHGGQ